MTLLVVPAWLLPTVSTAVWPGAISRDRTVGSRTTIMAASTTGSMVFCGMEPWPPRPYTVILMLSAADKKGPERVPAVPATPEDMLGQGNVRRGDAREQAVVDHSLGAVAGLLGGLEQREQGAIPLAGVNRT